MSDPYRQRKHYLEHSPEYDEDDGSKRVQTFATSQDAGAHQYHHAYHDTIQQVAQHPNRYPNQRIRPDEYQSQSPAQHTTRMSIQQLIHPEDDPEDDPEEYSDDCPHDDPVDYFNEYYVEYPTEHLIEPSFEHSNLHSHQFSGAQPTHGSHPATGTAQVTMAFEGLGLTASSPLRAPTAYSEPAPTALTVSDWDDDGERPPYDRPGWTPYGPVAQGITGFEIPGSEPPYSRADDWWLRISLANGHDLDNVANTLKRTIASVLDYVERNSLRWTLAQDYQLREMNVGDRSDMSEVRRHLDGSQYHDDYEVLARAEHLRWLEESAQQFIPVGTLQPGSQSDPMGTQRSEPGPPQVSEEVADKANLHPENRGFWTEDEIRKLHEWVAEHGTKWQGVEHWIPSRSMAAIVIKWGHIHRAEKAQQQIPLEPEEMSQPHFGDAPGDHKQSGKGLEDLKKKDLDFIKHRLAQGLRFSAIANIHYRGFRQRIIIKFLYFAGWLPWTPEEDESVLELQGNDAHEWAQIASNFSDPPRSEEELKTRFEYLLQKGELPRRTRGARYAFDHEDDEYIRISRAHGITFAQMCREEFPDLTLSSISQHAKAIGAVWDPDDDRWLRGLNLEPGATVDWRSIGRSFNPPRKAKNVQARWNFVHSEGYHRISSRGC